MNFYDLQNNFWRIDEQKSFTGNDTRLYFYLLYLANRAFWQTDQIEFGDEKMKAILGVSSAVLRTSRSRLKEGGLINFQSGGIGFRVKTRYQILTPNVAPNPDPKLNTIVYKNKINTKTNIKKNENRRFSGREFIADGSDFD